MVFSTSQTRVYPSRFRRGEDYDFSAALQQLVDWLQSSQQFNTRRLFDGNFIEATPKRSSPLALLAPTLEVYFRETADGTSVSVRHSFSLGDASWWARAFLVIVGMFIALVTKLGSGLILAAVIAYFWHVPRARLLVEATWSTIDKLVNESGDKPKSFPLFKSLRGEAEYQASYDATLRLWPANTPHERLYVPTRFGQTYVLAVNHKQQQKPVMIMLHGFLISSASWYPNVAALQEYFRIYAIDFIGDLGRSEPVRVPHSKQELVEWLLEVLQGLGIPDSEKINITGLSYGGFLGINFAVHAPHRVNKLVLLAPPCLVPLSWQFLPRTLSGFLLPFRWAAWNAFLWFAYNKNPEHLEVYEQGALVMLHARFPIGGKEAPFALCTDDELRRLGKVPTILILGEKEIVFNPIRAIERVKKLVTEPFSIETELVAEAGHPVCAEQPEVVNRRMLQFLLNDHHNDS